MLLRSNKCIYSNLEYCGSRYVLYCHWCTNLIENGYKIYKKMNIKIIH